MEHVYNKKSKNEDIQVPQGIKFLKDDSKEATILSEGLKTMKYCGLCDAQIQCKNGIKRHNEGGQHKKMLRKFNISLPIQEEEFIIYYISKPKGEICLDELNQYSKDPRLWCKVCSIPHNDVQNLGFYNNGKKHMEKLLSLGLPSKHDIFYYCEDYMKIPLYSSKFNINTLPVRYEIPLVSLSLIETFRFQGISIPTCVRRVLKVKRQFQLSEDEKYNFDLNLAIECSSQIKYSTVLVEDNIIIGLIVFNDIPLEECSIIEELSRGLYNCGGKVIQSSKKKTGRTVMCGWRRDMGKAAGSLNEFEWYSHGIRSKFQKDNISASELEQIGDYLTGELLAPIIKRQFQSYMIELQGLLSEDCPKVGLGRMENQCLTTLEVTSNYFAQPHVDDEDMGFAFLTWFTKEYEGFELEKQGGEFLFPEYNIFILPCNGTTFAFSTSKIVHYTRIAFGFDIMGMSCSAKKNVQKKASARTYQILEHFKKVEEARLYKLLSKAKLPQKVAPPNHWVHVAKRTSGLLIKKALLTKYGKQKSK